MTLIWISHLNFAQAMFCVYPSLECFCPAHRFCPIVGIFINEMTLNLFRCFGHASIVVLVWSRVIECSIHTGTLDAIIYRKPTHSKRYLNFKSDHLLEHKSAVVNALTHRANSLIRDDNKKRKKLKHILYITF